MLIGVVSHRLQKADFVVVLTVFVLIGVVSLRLQIRINHFDYMPAILRQPMLQRTTNMDEINEQQ